jgi:beta-phosphoglucomutase
LWGLVGVASEQDDIMDDSTESASAQPNDELQAIYDGSADGILVVEIGSRRFRRANSSICQLLGYSESELLSLRVDDIHPDASVPHILDMFEAMIERRFKRAQSVPCLRKDGDVVYADISVAHVTYHGRQCIVGFFHDVTEQKRATAAICATEERYRLIADNAADVIWTVDFPVAAVRKALAEAGVAAAVDVVLDQWRFSFATPAAVRLFKYTPEEIVKLSFRDVVTPDSSVRAREALIAEFTRSLGGSRRESDQNRLEVKVVAKDGSTRWCEVVSTYLRDESGMPVSLLGITRDATDRHDTEDALRESEGKLRSLFENLPDLVMVIDREAQIMFVNRDQVNATRESLLGRCAFELIVPEYQDVCRRGLSRAVATGQPQAFEVQDVVSLWWSCQVVPLSGEDGVKQVILICTNVTQERLAAERLKKEQQLLRRLLDLHERERQLIAYEIHDGFAQQLAGALFRLQGFRETFAKNPTEAWKGFDAASQLLCRAIDETRRLITGLRPPILDESGVFEAVQYLIYEQQKDDGPEIEFEHDMVDERFPPPLENAIFRIVQESLNNACRHSRSERIRVALARRDGRICIDVRDWGIGFDPSGVEEQRFGLQGIRERVRLLEGRVAIESAPGEGTHIAVELPLTPLDSAQAVIFDMDGVLVDTYQAHYESWRDLAEGEGLQVTEEEFASLFGRTSREIIARLWGSDRFDEAQIAELDSRKEAAFRRIIEVDFPAMPGAIELLRTLHGQGFRLAVGSSGPPENVGLVVDRLGARDLFQAIVTGEDVTRGKPNPEVFLMAAKRLGVSAANCAVIEDAPAGVEAANAAGMASIGLLSTGRKPEDLTEAHAVVRSLRELTPQNLHDAIARRPLQPALQD